MHSMVKVTKNNHPDKCTMVPIYQEPQQRTNTLINALCCPFIRSRSLSAFPQNRWGVVRARRMAGPVLVVLTESPLDNAPATRYGDRAVPRPIRIASSAVPKTFLGNSRMSTPTIIG